MEYHMGEFHCEASARRSGFAPEFHAASTLWKRQYYRANTLKIRPFQRAYMLKELSPFSERRRSKLKVYEVLLLEHSEQSDVVEQQHGDRDCNVAIGAASLKYVWPEQDQIVDDRQDQQVGRSQ